MEKIIIEKLRSIASEEKAIVLRRFFKTGKGEYGEGDIFWGITVPQVRAVAQCHSDAPETTIAILLCHPVHEVRLCGFLILVEKFKRNKKNELLRKKIVNIYIKYSSQANNWDLVDLSAPKILGEWLLGHPDPELLDRLSISPDLWQQRIAIVSTMTLIRAGKFDDTIRLSERFLTHSHPLIHKATGWMLREIGKKDQDMLIEFLDRHATHMPRTALRYAIERLPKDMKQHYMTL